ncbi:ATP-binding protein [Photobacterium kagoshimensis]|uniref:hybrid sensor histidine kinase/response regulator n=1 Tax=Photobacterium kagoshimensis TaxID=2910242 RepID=UPI003D0FF2CE
MIQMLTCVAAIAIVFCVYVRKQRQSVKQLQQELARTRQEAKVATEAKSQFLANISHEVRTPVSGMIGLLDLMQEQTLSPEIASLHRDLHLSANNLLHMVNDIIEHTEITTGAQSIALEETDLTQELSHLAQSHASYAHQKGLIFHYWQDPATSLALLADSTHIKHVLSNLLKNAVKFTEFGTIKLAIEVTHETQDTQTITFTVSDTGIGIPDEHQAQLFHPFSQADQSSSRRFNGAGLGLSIAHQLVGMMGGQLTCRSQVEAGSAFSFSLQLTKMPIDNESITPQDAQSFTGQSALIIGPLVQSTELTRYLTAWGLTLQTITGEGQTDWKKQVTQASASYLFIDLTLWQQFDFAQEALINKETKVIVFTPSSMLSPEPINQHWCLSTNPLIPDQLHHVLQHPVSHDAIIDTIASLSPHLYQESREQAEQTGRLVLVAEDHPINQRVIKQQLEKLNLHADIVSNGHEALDALKVNHYGLLLTDCHMPEMDGYSLVKTIRQQEKISQSDPLPVVALTANAVKAEEQHCLSIGMNDFFVKPVSQQALTAITTRWLPPIEADSAITSSSAEYLSSSNECANEDLLADEFATLLGAIEDSFQQANNDGAYEDYDDLFQPTSTEDNEEAHSLDQFNTLTMIDIAGLCDLFGDEETAKQLIAEFIHSHLTDMTLLNNAFHSGNYTALQEVAHKMKGAAKMVTCDPIAHALEQIEQTTSEIMKSSNETQKYYYADALTDHIDQLEQLTQVLLANN